MELYICIIIYAVVFIVIRFSKLDTTSNRIILLFTAYWFVATLLSIIQVAGLCAVSSSTYTLVYIHLISFVLGFLSIKINTKQTYFISREMIENQINKIIYNPWFIVILLVCTIYIIVLYLQFFQRIVALGSMTDARGEYYGGGGEIYGATFFLINQFLLQPLNTVLLPIFAYKLYYKRDFVFWLITIFILVMASLSGGRISYVRIAAVILCVLICIFDSIKNKRKLILYTSLGLVGLYFILVITSAARFGSLGFNRHTYEVGRDVAMEHLSTYSAGPIAALDYSIKDDYLSKVGGFKYGRLTLTSVDRMACMVLRRFGVNAVDAMDKVADIKQNNWIVLGDVSFNALYTSIIIYYLDFGIWGVIFLPFLIGRLVRYFIKRMYKYNTLPYVIIVSWFFYIIVRTVMDFGFYNPSDALLLFVLLWLGKRNKIQQSI